MHLRLFVESGHCRSRAHCGTCRAKEAGRTWRERLALAGLSLPNGDVDFECPHGVPWGATPPPPPPPKPLSPGEREKLRQRMQVEQTDQFHALWRKLHTHPTGSPDLIASVRQGLPCGECVQHFGELLAERPPEFGAGWHRYTHWLHNRVNQITGKPPMPYPAAAALYGWT